MMNMSTVWKFKASGLMNQGKLNLESQLPAKQEMLIALRLCCMGVRVQYSHRAIKIRLLNEHFLPGQYSEQRTV